MKNYRWTQAFLMLIAISASPVTHAAWYQVEVIVFQQLQPDTDGEVWYENPGLPERTNSIELITLADEEKTMPANDESADEIQAELGDLIPYRELNNNYYRLDGIYRVLKLSRAYKPLLHVAWQQPGLPADRARAVHFQGFEEFLDEGKEPGGANPDDSDRLDSAGKMEYQVRDLIFDGTVRLRSSRFLHVDLDVAFFPGTSVRETMNDDSAMSYQQADYVRLRESRKIKLNEIHYFDHPLFGLLLRVSRLKLH